MYRWPVEHNPDSWEGWYWGAGHHCGPTACNAGAETYSTVEDFLKHRGMVVFWSADPEATSGVYGAEEGTFRRQWLEDLGIPLVHYDGEYVARLTVSFDKWRAYIFGEKDGVPKTPAWQVAQTESADAIPPACTNFERWDFGEFANGGGYIQHSFTQCNQRVAAMRHKCVEPSGESRSDQQMFLDLPARLGLGAMYSEGMTELDWCRRLFDGTDLPRAVS